MSEDTNKPGWIPDYEAEDVKIKWGFSHFDGREDTFNAEGDHNFTIILPEEDAIRLKEEGWSVRTIDGYEEGDPPEHLLKVKISFKFEDPKIYLIKGERKFRADKRDLADIKRATAERIDVIVTPSRWVHGGNSGISAYAKELYAVVKESRFSAMYADFEEV